MGDTNVINAMLTPEFAYDVRNAMPDVHSDGMTPRVQNLREKVQATGASFELDSLHLLDACSAIIEAIEAAQSVDPQDVIAAIDSGVAAGFEGSYGPAHWGAYPEVYGNKHCAEHQMAMSTFTPEGIEFEWVE